MSTARKVSFTTKDTNFPPGTSFTGYLVSILDANGVTVATQAVPAGVVEATFDPLPVGDGYQASVQAKSGDVNLGAPSLSDPFSVTADAPQVVVPLPDAVSVVTVPNA